MLRKMTKGLAPASWWFAAGLVLLLLLAPQLISSRATLNMLTYIFIFSVFAMSYDILLGYTGIISFGHALFFGVGAYAVGLLLRYYGATFPYLLLALLITLVIAVVLSLIIGILSLRVKQVYYFMITLAFAELFFILAEKWRSVTFGNDGFSFRAPELLHDRVFFYYLALAFVIAGFFTLRQFVNSPTGRVLQAIRENEQRAVALGYDVLRYKLIATMVAGVTGSLAGAVYALHMRFVSTGVLGVHRTIDALVATVLGGQGTLIGGIIGAGLTTYARDLLSDVSKIHPLLERWYILFGLIYILIILYMPGGIVGGFNRVKFRLQQRWVRRAEAQRAVPKE
jgi:branched-chain amino acid transport system permease protein